MIVDSNTLIDAVRPDRAELRTWLQTSLPAYSTITRLEVLGYKGIDPEDEAQLKTIFAAMVGVSVTDDLIDAAIELRQARRMSLGDSIIAASALALGASLATANERDFKNIPGLTVFNPMRPNTAHLPTGDE